MELAIVPGLFGALRSWPAWTARPLLSIKMCNARGLLLDLVEGDLTPAGGVCGVEVCADVIGHIIDLASIRAMQRPRCNPSLFCSSDRQMKRPSPRVTARLDGVVRVLALTARFPPPCARGSCPAVHKLDRCGRAKMCRRSGSRLSCVDPDLTQLHANCASKSIGLIGHITV